jgi:hypothetical protein
MKAALPCPDAVWEASTAQKWKPLFLQYKKLCQPSTITMGEVMSDVIHYGNLTEAVGSFGRLALIHAVYETIFELRRSLQHPLNNWLGFGTHAQATNSIGWQERFGSFLEALQPKREEVDATNAIRGLSYNSGWQSPLYILTSAQHVFLRVFSPIGDLLIFAGPSAEDSEKLEARERLIIWIEDDHGRTARRAVLHACTIFTLIRSNPCYSFHEPIAFLAATLTIWTYNWLTPSMRQQNIASTYPVIQLDRIWSTKAAELWIDASPAAVRGYLTEVGCINDSKAAEALLDLACESLLLLSVWGLSQGFANFLNMLKIKSSTEGDIIEKLRAL